MSEKSWDTLEGREISQVIENLCEHDTEGGEQFCIMCLRRIGDRRQDEIEALRERLRMSLDRERELEERLLAAQNENLKLSLLAAQNENLKLSSEKLRAADLRALTFLIDLTPVLAKELSSRTGEWTLEIHHCDGMMLQMANEQELRSRADDYTRGFSTHAMTLRDASGTPVWQWRRRLT